MEVAALGAALRACTTLLLCECVVTIAVLVVHFSIPLFSFFFVVDISGVRVW